MHANGPSPKKRPIGGDKTAVSVNIVVDFICAGTQLYVPVVPNLTGTAIVLPVSTDLTAHAHCLPVSRDLTAHAHCLPVSTDLTTTHSRVPVGSLRIGKKH